MCAGPTSSAWRGLSRLSLRLPGSRIPWPAPRADSDQGWLERRSRHWIRAGLPVPGLAGRAEYAFARWGEAVGPPQRHHLSWATPGRSSAGLARGGRMGSSRRASLRPLKRRWCRSGWPVSGRHRQISNGLTPSGRCAHGKPPDRGAGHGNRTHTYSGLARRTARKASARRLCSVPADVANAYSCRMPGVKRLRTVPSRT